MKLLFLIYSMGRGGAERVTAILANELSAAGHQITIALLEEGRSAYPLSPAVEVLSLAVAARGRAPGPALRFYRRQRAINAMLRRCRPDAAIGMMVSSAIHIGMAPKLPAMLRIGSERADPRNDGLPRVWRLLRRFIYPRMELHVAQTAAVADWLGRHTGARRVAIIPNPYRPLPPQSCGIRPADVLNPDDAVVLAVGRLGPEKGFDLLIAAFARAARDDRTKLVILGEGSERARLEEAVAAFSLQGRVLLPGRVDSPREWYERAQIFVLSSRFEGFPNVLLEALAHGTPCVSVRCYGATELIQHEVNGLLVPQNDPAGLAAAMARLLTDDALRASLAQQGRNSVHRYAAPDIAQRWLAAIENAGNPGQ